MAVYFYYGTEHYNIDKALNNLKSKINPEYGSLNYHVYQYPQYADLITAISTPSMMFGNSLIVINAYGYFFKVERKEIKFEQQELNDIEEALNSNQEGVDIVFVVKLPRESKKKDDNKISTTNKLFKLLNKFNAQEYKQLLYYETDKLVNCIMSMAKEKGVSFDNDAATILAENTGTNLQQIDLEIDKLANYAYPDKKITKKMVEQISISHQIIFDITDAIAKNRNDLALLEVKKILYTNEPLKIISAIQTTLSEWIIILSKSNELSTDEIGKIIGRKSGYVYNKLKSLKNVKLNTLVKLRKNLIEAEYNIKSGNEVNPDEEVLYAFSR